jgi:hypothetical protein
MMSTHETLAQSSIEVDEPESRERGYRSSNQLMESALLVPNLSVEIYYAKHQ